MKTLYQTLENRKRKKSNPGTKKVPRYIRKIDENGQPTMVVKEMFNLYEDIQTYKDDNNIITIARKLGMKPEQLDFNQGRNYLDMSKIPESYNDIMNQRSDIFSDYLKLPIEFKQKIGNNFDIYYGLVMNGSIEKIINSYKNGTLEKIDVKKATQISEKEDNTDAIRKSTENEQEKNNIQT